MTKKTQAATTSVNQAPVNDQANSSQRKPCSKVSLQDIFLQAKQKKVNFKSGSSLFGS